MTLPTYAQLNERVKILEEALAKNWLPIESAPKDGTEVEVLFDSASVEIVRLCWWHDGGCDNMPGKPETTGWWSYEHSVTQELVSAPYRVATHWKPFIAPQQ